MTHQHNKNKKKRPTARRREDATDAPSQPAAPETPITQDAPINRPAGQASRRSFFWVFGILLAFVVLFEYLMIAVDFLRPRRRRVEEDADQIVRAGPIDRFKRNTVTAFPEGKFYLSRAADGGFLAISRECTHLGCTVPWIASEKQFMCPCHASAFDINGEVINPPAPRPLDLYAVRIENGIVKVDISQSLKRESYTPTQITRP